MLAKSYILTFFIVLLMGCATGGTVRPVELAAVEIGKTDRPGCAGVDGFSLTCNSRDELVTVLKRQAQRSGANFVKVTSLRVGHVTGRVKVRGIAMICPAKLKQVEPQETVMMPAIDEPGPDTQTKLRSIETAHPDKLPDLSTLNVPESEDENPFE